MAMDAIFAYPDAVLALAIAPDGSLGGFLQLVPAPASGTYSLASMRRRRETPNGLMEFLIAGTIEWARERGVGELSLNFSVFAEYLGREPLAAADADPEGRPAVPARAPAQLQPQVLSRSGAAATSASSAGPTSRSRRWPTCKRNRC